MEKLKSKVVPRIELKVPVMSSKLVHKHALNLNEDKNLIHKTYVEPKEFIFEDYYVKLLDKTFKCPVEPKLKTLYKEKKYESTEYLETGATYNEDSHLLDSHIHDSIESESDNNC